MDFFHLFKHVITLAHDEPKTNKIVVGTTDLLENIMYYF